MYDLIEPKRSVRKLYTEALIGRGDITLEEAEQALRTTSSSSSGSSPRPARRDAAGRAGPPCPTTRRSRAPRHRDRDHRGGRSSGSPTPTSRLPEGFTVHPQGAAAAAAAAPRWSTRTRSTGRSARCSRSARCCIDGRPVRLAGQDTRRGTFAQRHAVLIDRQTGDEYTPLRNLDATTRRRSTSTTRCCRSTPRSASSTATRSPAPRRWSLWEAQFGDFVNGAQSIIDEFISSGEDKWGQRSGVVLLLPHGYEGQGPDHSSARIERFLQLCAEDNMTVAHAVDPGELLPPAAPARAGRRAPAADRLHARSRCCASRRPPRRPQDFTDGPFMPVIDDPTRRPTASRCDRVLLCSGKVYYDLVGAPSSEATAASDARSSGSSSSTRCPTSELKAALARYPHLRRTSAGCRRSRPTWAPGRTCASTCSPSSSTPVQVISRPAVQAHRRWAQQLAVSVEEQEAIIDAQPSPAGRASAAVAY